MGSAAREIAVGPLTKQVPAENTQQTVGQQKVGRLSSWRGRCRVCRLHHSLQRMPAATVTVVGKLMVTAAEV
eukprot:42616-Chlamydomonas_euryale.AAC.1